MGKKIKTAKRASELPTPHFIHVMTEIRGKSARGAVMAAAAYLDLLLREAIELHLRDDVAVQNILFEANGPLQDFSSRIHLAYAMKIIGWGAYSDLKLIKDIRNAFAHCPTEIGFDHEDVARLCDRLWFPAHVIYVRRPTVWTARGRFIRAFELIADGLAENVARQAAHITQSDFLQMGPPQLPAVEHDPFLDKPQSQSQPNARRKRKRSRPTRLRPPQPSSL